MNTGMGWLSWAALLAATAVFGASSGRPQEGGLSPAVQRAVEAAAERGGLAVLVGCRDLKRLGAFAAARGCVVQGLDRDAAVVARARAWLREQGLLGRTTVRRWDGRRLPYVDHLVNVLIAERLEGEARAEAMRVLAPGGVLLVRDGAGWRREVKPRPPEMDDWTHYLHDASNNAVAHDQLVGPPRHLQWVAGPRHARSHEHTPTVWSVVSSGGRIFYIVDEGSTASIRREAQWRLVARDAFNGLVLWKRPLASWYPHIINWGATPRQLERKLVAANGRVYATLGLFAPVEAVDAATGRTVKTYPGTEGAEEMLLCDGVLLVVVRKPTADRRLQYARVFRLEQRDGSPLFEREAAEPVVSELKRADGRAPREIVALDAESGSLLWKKTGAEAAGLRTLSLCADGGRVFRQLGSEVVCADLKTGRRLWSRRAPPLRLAARGVAACAGGDTVTLLDARTGEPRWTRPLELVDIRDAFVIGDSLWLGGFQPCPGKRGPSWGPYFARQRSLATGEVLRRVDPENPQHHHRCYLNKATDRYILGGRRGVEFIDVATGDYLWHSWVRGVCKYGVMPANGLLYAPPDACACYVAAKLQGFYALAGSSMREGSPPADDAGRLERGPAFGDVPQGGRQPGRGDWPTYRRDARRSGFSPAGGPKQFAKLWRTELGGRLTAPTVVGDQAFVASVEDHRVCAVNAQSGALEWERLAGGRVDSPPTWLGGALLFGCRDGRLYCVRAADGQLAWSLLAARGVEQASAHGQLESVWPLTGSVLVREGQAVAAAGRSSYLDGGIDLLRVRPADGQILARHAIYSPDEQGRQPPQAGPADMPGALLDILSADDEAIFLRDMMLDENARQLDHAQPHLFTLTGFLDDTWAHRSYWIFGVRCSIACGCSGRDRNLIYGRLLAFNEDTVFGYGRSNVHWSNHMQDGPYRLFARSRADGAERWTARLPIQARALAVAGDVLYVAGPPLTPLGPFGAGEAPDGSLLLAFSAADGKELARRPLDRSPVLDGLAVANGRIYLALEDGSLVCYGSPGD